MSGIAAILDRDGGAPQGLVEAMLDRLAHRGPDRSGTLVAGRVAVAQCTLETTAEDAMDPLPLRRLSRRGGELWIVADARLDNREALLSTGDGSLHPAGPVSDAELILRAYEQWGEGCPGKLLGDFAFIVWDAERRRFFCARDHLGVRPLYYRDDAHGFRCASEMQALFADPRVPRRVHAPSARLFLAYRYAEQGETLWDGVRSVPSGHSLVATDLGVTLRRYWAPDPHAQVVGSTPAERAEQLREAFTEAVRCRMRSSRPLASNLSGGLDSSSVVSVAARLRAEGRVATPLTPMRLCFPGLPCDESRYSQAVAERWDLPLVTCLPLERLELCRPDPAATAGDVYFHPTVLLKEVLFEAASERGIRTTLTGIGGDQLLHQTGFECASLLRRRDLRRALAEARAGRRVLGAARMLAGRGVLPLLPQGLQRAVRRARGVRPGIPWLSASTLREIEASDEAAWARQSRLHDDPAVASVMDSLMLGPDLGLGLMRMDRHAARRRADERHPFLDVRVVELLVAFPCDERFDRGTKKPVLRRALADTLPPMVRDRTDAADFNSYIRAAFVEPFQGEIRRLLEGSLLESEGLVDGEALRSAGSLRVPPFHFANLVALELWLRCAQHEKP